MVSSLRFSQKGGATRFRHCRILFSEYPCPCKRLRHSFRFLDALAVLYHLSVTLNVVKNSREVPLEKLANKEKNWFRGLTLFWRYGIIDYTLYICKIVVKKSMRKILPRSGGKYKKIKRFFRTDKGERL